MTSLAPKIDNRIPLAIAECCREWIVPVGYRGGSCGYCGERPEFRHMLPEDEWLTPAPPIRPEGWE